MGRKPNLDLRGRLEASCIPVTESGCWLWEKEVIRSGYGRLCSQHKRFIASRLSWEIYRGPIPPGMFVCHKCDTPSCVNPDHLFVGTPKDNTQDMFAKNRAAHIRRREACNLTKFNREIVRSIFSDSGTLQQIGDRHGVSGSMVLRIRQRILWTEETADLPDPVWNKKKWKRLEKAA